MMSLLIFVTVSLVLLNYLYFRKPLKFYEMKLSVFTLVLWVFTSTILSASIKCPPDKNLSCHDDIHYLPLVGQPTVFGGWGQLTYTDQYPNNACRVGHIIRTWFLDQNGNQQLDSGESGCIQNLYVSYTPGTVVIDWPVDLVLNCKDAIPNTNPTWTSGPCDMIGVSKVDEVFRTGNDACYKILRNFKVINWCTHIPGTTIGMWTHTQVIKVEDTSRPSIQQCGEVILGTNVGCQATFQVSNSAIDISPCGEQKLFWTAEVDLWSDGSIEYRFAHNQSDPEFLFPIVKSGQLVSLKLPFPVMRGYHKVTWSVHDQCGNVTKCVQKVFVKDTKKPTPYMYQVLSTAFDGKDHPLKVSARIFNAGSVDNCTKNTQLKYSFSPNVNDTIRTIDCNNAGFQFFNIYVTDWEGNQDFAEVFLLAFDNGSCSTLRMKGSVKEGNGSPLSNVELKLSRTSDDNMEMMAMSDPAGGFSWDNIGIYKDMFITPYIKTQQENRLNIADLKMLQDYIFGTFSLENFQYLAADVDGNGKIRVNDVQILKERILKQSVEELPWTILGEVDSVSNASQLSLLYQKNKIELATTKGTLGFKAIYKGDLTDANVVNTEPRSVLAYHWEQTQDGYALFLDHDMTIEGLQVEFKSDIAREISLHSEQLHIPSNAIFADDTHLRFVALDRVEVNSNLPLLTLKNLSDDQIVLTANSKILLDQYQTRSLKLVDDKISDMISIAPNPAQQTFTLVSGFDVTIESIQNQAGQKVSFIQSGNSVYCDAPSGLYFVNVISEGKVTIHKLIKI